MSLEAWLLAVGHIGIIAAVFAESGVLIGIFLPGDSLLITAGLLAAAGYLNIWLLVPCCIIAAIAGDSVGYATGKYLGPRVFTGRSRFLKKEYITRTEAFFKRYGPVAVVFARFTPIVRTITPVMAGVGTMHYRTFLIYNIIGGFLWAGLLLTLSYFAGIYIPGITEYLDYIIVGVILLSLLPLIFRKKSHANSHSQSH